LQVKDQIRDGLEALPDVERDEMVSRKIKAIYLSSSLNFLSKEDNIFDIF